MSTTQFRPRFFGPLLLLSWATAAQAQTIIPSNDGTNTVVNAQGSQFNITGGQLSSDRTNLFHSFSQFGLDVGQSANFRSNSTVQNIFGRVTGGNPSVINGLIQLTGGNSNLFLINPSGILFGANARLDLPGSLTATTANNIEFGSNHWSAIGANNYATLVGNPTAFSFPTVQPGVLVNSGDLTLAQGNLTLLGGTVVSTGRLTAAKGQITVATIPGEHRVRLSQVGSLLSLDIPSTIQPERIQPLSLPQILTGGNLQHAQGLNVGSDGKIRLSSGGIEVRSGDLAVSQLDADSATLKASQQLTLVESQLKTQGDLNLLADQTVFVRDSLAQPFLAQSGGNITVQGNQGIDILALNHLPQNAFVSGQNLTLISDGIISTDAHFQSGGDFSIRNLNGGIANFLSLYDPIFTTVGDYAVGDYTGASLQVNAGGNITYGNVTIDGIAPPVHPTNPAFFLDAGGTITGSGLVNTIVPAGQLLVNFQANGDITTGPIRTQGGTVDLRSNSGSIASVGTIDTSVVGAAAAGAIAITATTGNVQTGDLVSSVTNTLGNAGNSGAIAIAATNGAITTGNIQAFSQTNTGSAGMGGNVTLTALNSITTGQINTHSRTLITGNVNNAGSVNITSTAGGITSSLVNAFSSVQGGIGNSANAGSINLNAAATVQIGELRSVSSTVSGTAGNGNNITVTANRLNMAGFTLASEINSSSTGTIGSGTGGAINLNTAQFDFNVGAFPAMRLNAGRNDVNLNGNINGVGNLSVNGQNIRLNNITIQTIGNQFYESPVRVNGNNSLTSQYVGVAPGINLNASLDGTTSNLDTLTINANSGNLLVNGAIGSGVNLQKLDIQSSQNTNFNSPIGTPTQPTGDIQTTSSGITRFGQPVYANSLSTTGTAQFAGNVTTVNDQNYANVELLSPNILFESTNGNISIGGTLNAQSPGGSSFTAKAAGSIFIYDNIGLDPAKQLQDLRLEANNIQMAHLNLDPGDQIINTLGSQTYSSTIGLSSPNTLFTSINGNLQFDGVIDTELGSGTNGFGAIARAGSVNFNGALGVINPLGAVTIQANRASRLSQNIRTDNGKVEIQAPDLSTADIASGGADIALTAPNGLVTGTLNTIGLARSGNISLTSLNASTGSVRSNDLITEGNIQAGNVTVKADRTITTKAINTSSKLGIAGNVLLDPTGDVIVDSINAEGFTVGGNIDITAGSTFGDSNRGFFRANQTFTSLTGGSPVSLSSFGRNQSGTITIRHDGGDFVTPFLIGDATQNGTVGEVLARSDRLLLAESFPFALSRGLVQLVTSSAPIIPPTPPVIPPVIPPIVTPPTAPAPEPPTRTPQIQSTVPPELPTASSNRPSSPILAFKDAPIDIGVENRDAQFSQEYRDYYGLAPTPKATVEEARELADQIEQATGAKPAFLYVSFVPNSVPEILDSHPKSITASKAKASKDLDILEIIIVTGKGQPPLRQVLPQVTRQQVINVAREFRGAVSDRESDNFLEPAQQLYQWLITPIQATLQERKINNLLFMMDGGLRALPLAALHDGKQFLVENYSIGMAPSLSLTHTNYVSLKQTQVFAMGASEFREHAPLPAVPIELNTITQQLWKGQSMLNQHFTFDNLLAQRQKKGFGILHLATHGDFKPGSPQASYIQFWDRKLQLNQIRSLGLDKPPLELLILSACRTAVGDRDAELGFAGLAAQAGVKSAIASLWEVSDAGTLALMTNLYSNLAKPNVRTKSEGLRQTQMAMLKGNVKIENGTLLSPNLLQPLQLPGKLLELSPVRLTHPYYWSAFTIVGSPW